MILITRGIRKVSCILKAAADIDIEKIQELFEGFEGLVGDGASFSGGTLLSPKGMSWLHSLCANAGINFEAVKDPELVKVIDTLVEIVRLGSHEDENLRTVGSYLKNKWNRTRNRVRTPHDLRVFLETVLRESFMLQEKVKD